MKWEFTSWGKTQHTTTQAYITHTPSIYLSLFFPSFTRSYSFLSLAICLHVNHFSTTLVDSSTYAIPSRIAHYFFLFMFFFLSFFACFVSSVLTLTHFSFSLLVPLVSKVCPSDVYRVWKSGSCLRVDTTLLGFEHMTWLKGRRSYIFKGGGE